MESKEIMMETEELKAAETPTEITVDVDFKETYEEPEETGKISAGAVLVLGVGAIVGGYVLYKGAKAVYKGGKFVYTKGKELAGKIKSRKHPEEVEIVDGEIVEDEEA